MPKVTPAIAVAISAPPKTGKTDFAFTFPDPVLVYSFDLRGAELLLPPFKDRFKGRDITIRKFPAPLLETVHPKKDDPIIGLMGKIEEQYKQDLGMLKDKPAEKHFNTVILDPGTTLWEMIRYSFEAVSGHELGKARNYGEPNARMTWFIMQPAYLGKNVVITQYVKEKYLADVGTGELIPDGFKATIGLVDVAMTIERRGSKERTTFYPTITDCRFDHKLTGVELPANSGYGDLMMMLGLS